MFTFEERGTVKLRLSEFLSEPYIVRTREKSDKQNILSEHKQSRQNIKISRNMARHISTIKDVDEFCQVNLKDIIKRKNRWIRPNYKCDWEKGLFEKSIRFAGVSSEKNFLKMASKAKRNAWSCNFNNAIRQWLSKHNFPNEVQKDQVLHTNKCVRRSSDQSSVKSCEQNKLTNSEHDDLDSEAFGSQEGEMISADMDLDMKIQESALDVSFSYR